jgi:putative ABC transport system permease protein
VATAPVGVLAETRSAPSDREEQAARSALEDVSPNLQFDTERGYQDPLSWQLYALIAAAGLIAVAAAAIATALANVDRRPDLITLGAVGASPRTRRVLSMSRAGVIATIGCLLGVGAGFVPALAWIKAGRTPGYQVHVSRSYFLDTGHFVPLRLVVPWLPLVVAAVGVPVVAVLFAGVFSRSRLPSERPAE